MNFLDLLQAFKGAKSVSELDHLLKLYLTMQGISGYSFTYFAQTRTKGQKLNHEVVSERVKPWHNYYHEAQHDDIDSTHRKVVKSLLPVFWDVRKQIAEAGTEKERKMREESLNFGVTEGVSIPLHGPEGDFAELTLRQFKGETCMQNWESKQQEWYLVALAYFNYLREIMLLSEVKKSGLLTRREQQCLNLLAENYAMAEIAAMLNMTERTVNFHIQNINHKLKVRNKYEAVAKGRALGLVQ